MFAVLLAGCAAPLPALAPGTPAFGVLGDTPYSAGEIRRLDALIDDLNARELAFVVHVGDIGTSAQACADGWVRARKAQFARIRAPFILLPGDNEWSDCHARGADPMARLARWRGLFCSNAGQAPLRIERQPGEYCEHMRWRHGDALFVALNVPGNNNNARHAEYAARMRAVLAWLDEAERLDPAMLVVLMQANPFVPRAGYASLVDRLEAIAARRPGRIVLVHGDTHVYKDDEPLPGLRRIEVWGSPFVSWLRATLDVDRLQVESAGQY